MMSVTQQRKYPINTSYKSKHPLPNKYLTLKKHRRKKLHVPLEWCISKVKLQNIAPKWLTFVKIIFKPSRHIGKITSFFNFSKSRAFASFYLLFGQKIYSTCQTFNNKEVVIGTFLILVNHTVAIAKPQFNKKMHYYYSNYSIDPQRLMETAPSILWLHP